MAEESAVNYWEVSPCYTSMLLVLTPCQKYGHVAFDSTQKAVLTSCVLRYKPVVNTNSSNSAGSGIKEEPSDDMGATQPTEAGFINCCFSFTIRRDKWGIPSMIVGNFIAC
jgi:hypothetical protein